MIMWYTTCAINTKQRCVHRSKSCYQTLKHFDNVFATGGNNIVEVFESLTTSFWTMHTPLFSGHLGAFDALSSYPYNNYNAKSKNLPSSGTKWLPIMTYIHPPENEKNKYI